MKFKNPANSYVEESPRPWLWALLFGFFYFAYKGSWEHAIIGAILALPTVGLSWVVYAFFARSIVRGTYLKKGWVEA